MTASRRVALITGASSGIGAATARELAQRGYALALAARRSSELSRLAGELTAQGGTALPIPTDICDPAQITRLARLTLEHFGQVDVLVNNAGINQHHRAWRPSDEQIATVLQTNFSAPVQLTREIMPGMLERRRGHIINIGSAAGHIGAPGMSLYSASKYALRGWNDALRREVMHQGIAVSLVSPGLIRTPMAAGTRGIPMPGPELVARVVAQLLERPRREVVVPAVYAPFVWLDRLLPGLADALLSRLRSN